LLPSQHYHLSPYLLFARKLARYRAQLLEPGPGAGSGGGTGFDVSKSGDARIALVGFPSVGKSTFLSKITKTKSEVAAYSFTTLTAIPGVLEYGGAEIQILDLPGIIEGAAEGKGRGRQVISAAKTSDMILMVLDATKKAEQRALLEAELEAVGIRLNREPPYDFSHCYSLYVHLPQWQVSLTFIQQRLPQTQSRRRHENHLPNTPQKPRSKDDLQHSPRLQNPQLRGPHPRREYHRRRLHRRNHERAPQIHQVLVRVQQDRQRVSRFPGQACAGAQHRRHVVRDGFGD
jgi:small GTP-binding protein